MADDLNQSNRSSATLDLSPPIQAAADQGQPGSRFHSRPLTDDRMPDMEMLPEKESSTAQAPYSTTPVENQDTASSFSGQKKVTTDVGSPRENLSDTWVPLLSLSAGSKSSSGATSASNRSMWVLAGSGVVVKGDEMNRDPVLPDVGSRGRSSTPASGSSPQFEKSKSRGSTDAGLPCNDDEDPSSSSTPRMEYATLASRSSSSLSGEGTPERSKRNGSSHLATLAKSSSSSSSVASY